MKKINNIFVYLILLAVFIAPAFVFAQSSGGGGVANTNPTGSVNTTGSTQINVHIENPFVCKGGQADCTLMDFVYAILNNIVMPIAAVFVVLWIIYAGFQFITAQGNEKKIGDAKQNLLWSLIGAGILLGSAAIAEVVKNTIDLLKT